MLYLSISLSIIICTFFIARFLAATTRLVEKDINATIARKLSTSPVSADMRRLTEENGVLRNLLIDMVENEASVPRQTSETANEVKLAIEARTRRRREIFGEAVFTLQQAGKSRIAARTFKING
ncbi:hypothetical protein [Pararhizobium sp. PWRC1-1]|uniref:hypothetical protein n=1 Tax=Pararhizobium sp. PWRC1-1 TaxID=2804566 RepID=UPI003CFA4285